MDAGPDPDPAKAADGEWLKRLEAHPVHVLAVKWIFAQYIKQQGRGLLDIAEELTRQGDPVPFRQRPGPRSD